MNNQATIRCDKETARSIAQIKLDLRARNADEVLQHLIDLYRKSNILEQNKRKR